MCKIAEYSTLRLPEITASSNGITNITIEHISRLKGNGKALFKHCESD